MANNSTAEGEVSKTAKPYPDFPLFAHATGRWAKKIRGKMAYFGKVADGWEKALQNFQDQRDDLYAGRTPKAKIDGVTVSEVVNVFLNAKAQMRDAGELDPRTWCDYHITGKKMAAFFGPNKVVSQIQPKDFVNFRLSMTKTMGPVAVGNQVLRTRVVFNWAVKNKIVAEPDYGPDFVKPSRRAMRLDKASKPSKTFSRDEVKLLLDNAPNTMIKAAILLGINCALGTKDICIMPSGVLDLESGWLDYLRNKTGEPRKSCLWPETVAAIKTYISDRPKPKNPDHAGLMFLTQYGCQCRCGTTAGGSDYVTKTFASLLKRLNMHKKGRGFYGLRHTFRTVGDAAGDANAIRYMMGHTDSSVEAGYIHGIDEKRLLKVSNYVHDWLFPKNSEHGTDDRHCD